jgi:cytochrome c oxidase cbb3-type subunit 3
MTGALKLSFVFVLGALLGVSCKREERIGRVPPPSADIAEMVSVSALFPGSLTPNPPVKNDYEDNSNAMNEGQHLYNSFNCVGCHAHGGGDKGPPLMDDKWIYGSQPQQVFASIVEGRPKGMPSFRGKLNDHQVWEIVAYVRSLSGQTPHTAATGRDEHMQTQPAPNSIKKETPKDVSSPE